MGRGAMGRGAMGRGAERVPEIFRLWAPESQEWPSSCVWQCCRPQRERLREPPAVPSATSQLPHFRWEFSKLSIGSWAVASAIGYVLCAPLPAPPHPHAALTRSGVTGFRPKWYPTIERPKATAFTPKELEEWNKGMVGPHAAEAKR